MQDPHPFPSINHSHRTSSAPAISVLMAVRDGLPYLSESVESILGQTFKDFEFIIVDDGSTDGGANWLRQRATTDSRIRIITQANTGIAKALNKGLEIVKGKYIARMDADDVASPDRFYAQMEAMEQDPELAIVGAAIEMMTAEGWVYRSKSPPEAHEDIRSALLRGDAQALIHPVVMIRKEAMLAVGCYDERFSTSQDLDLFLRLTEYGRASNLPATLLRYRQHSESSNSRRSHLWQETTRLAVLSALERVGPRAFVDAMFPRPFRFNPNPSELAIARIAERSGRFWMANRLAISSLPKSSSRIPAMRFIAGIWLRRAGRFILRE